ncbi:MAG: hypothetical protein LBP75_05695 [Planctomycetota bacterium]|nr:hypothetical protein [Planctomycetota bacterium]
MDNGNEPPPYTHHARPRRMPLPRQRKTYRAPVERHSFDDTAAVDYYISTKTRIRDVRAYRKCWIFHQPEVLAQARVEYQVYFSAPCALP